MFGDSRLPERFWSKVRVDASGCWLWAGCRRRGYGRIRAAGRIASAHRLAYEALVGVVADGLDLDHVCRTRACVNPAHLEPVTRLENLRRSSALRVGGERQRAKTHCPAGHAYDEANTYRRGGNRYCRACRRLARAAVRNARRPTDHPDQEIATP